LAEEVKGPGGVQLVATGRSPEERTLAHDAARTVALALRALKPVFREAVVLRDIEGLTYEEMAEVLEIRLGTVRSRIARGRQHLRRAVEARRLEESS
jgi:RNA polymerase sigma-70 factor (ECF subfamily)